MARVRFLTPAADPRAGQEGIVYGPNHETDFQDEDKDFVMTLWREGKVEILDYTGLTPPGGPPPEGGEGEGEGEGGARAKK